MKQIIYTGLLIASFAAGRYWPENKPKPVQRKFEAMTLDDNWYLKYQNNKIPLTIVNNSPQLGSIKYRMRGLLEENVIDLKYSLAKIKESLQDSN